MSSPEVPSEPLESLRRFRKVTVPTVGVHRALRRETAEIWPTWNIQDGTEPPSPPAKEGLRVCTRPHLGGLAPRALS